MDDFIIEIYREVEEQFIEADTSARKHCGGEDCVCCEIYQERTRELPEGFGGFVLW